MSTCIIGTTAIQGAVAQLLNQEQDLRQRGLDQVVLELLRVQVFQINPLACSLAMHARLLRRAACRCLPPGGRQTGSVTGSARLGRARAEGTEA
jgi:hypothetical protein